MRYRYAAVLFLLLSGCMTPMAVNVPARTDFSVPVYLDGVEIGRCYVSETERGKICFIISEVTK